MAVWLLREPTPLALSTAHSNGSSLQKPKLNRTIIRPTDRPNPLNPNNSVGRPSQASFCEPPTEGPLAALDPSAVDGDTKRPPLQLGACFGDGNEEGTVQPGFRQLVAFHVELPQTLHLLADCSIEVLGPDDVVQIP